MAGSSVSACQTTEATWRSKVKRVAVCGAVYRCGGVQHAAEDAAAPLGTLRAVLVILCATRPAIAVADHRRAEGIGSGDASSPARRDRRENLHRKRNQDYGQKVLQPPAHRNTQSEARITTSRVRSRGGVPGIILHAAMK